MNNTKGISDLLDALTANLSDREIAKAIIKSDLSATITCARVAANLSQAELARSIGKSQSTISKWEAGDTNFTIDMLVDIAADLNLDLTIKLNKPAARPAHKSGSGYTTSTAIIYNFPKVYSGPSYSIDDGEELKEM